MHQRTYDLSIPKTYHDQYYAPCQGRIQVKMPFIYIDLNVVIIYLQKRSVEMNPMA